MISEDAKEAIRIMQDGLKSSKTDCAALSDIGIAFVMICCANKQNPIEMMEVAMAGIQAGLATSDKEIARA